MFRKIMRYSLALSISLPAALTLAGARAATSSGQAAAPASAPATPASSLTVEQIIQKNVEARGGLAAWRAVQSIKETGKIDADLKGTVQLPFTLEMKRPRKTRLEIVFNGQTAVQAYDGTNGWTLRPYLGRSNPDPYSETELRKAAEQQDLDGPLVDYALKGTRAELVGTEQVEGKEAYKIKLTLNTGVVRHVWIDAKTFLELKMEQIPRVLNGKPHQVVTYFRDYRSVAGLVMPFTLETAVKDVVGTKKLTVETVQVNPKIDDAAFGKPESLPPSAMIGRGAAPAISIAPTVKN